MRKIISLILLILAFTLEAAAEEIRVPLAVVPQSLAEVGIVGDDWLGELPGSESLELIDGEDLEAWIDNGSFCIKKQPTREGTVCYRVYGEKTREVIFDVVIPDAFPDSAVLLDEKGNELEKMTLSVGETGRVFCHFIPEDWQFRGLPQHIALWVESTDVGDYDIRFEQEEESGTLCCCTPGEYRIGVKIGRANIVAYRFFDLTVSASGEQPDGSGNGDGTPDRLSEELVHASSLGFDTTRDIASPVTYRQLYELFDRLIELDAPGRLPEWQAANAEVRELNDTMNRASGMVAVFNLAEFLGDRYWYNNNSGNILYDRYPWDCGEWMPDNYWGDPLRFAAGFNHTYEDDGTNYAGSAYIYSMGRASLKTLNSLFDREEASMRCLDVFTYGEALLAVSRLYDSVLRDIVSADSNEARHSELCVDASGLPPASWNALPQWRGVTLGNMERMDYSSSGEPHAFSYEDMKDIASLGFNFIRVPLDVRLYIEASGVHLSLLENLDDLICWGAEFGIHICLDAHSTYGMVTSTPQNSLWWNPEEQDTFLKFWDLLAQRYADVPSSLLSFNLLNEPHEIDEAAYVELMKKAIRTIRTHSPDRLIFVDMLNTGRDPVYALAEDHVAQSFHFYEPRALTHCGIDDAIMSGYPVIQMKPMVSRDSKGKAEIVIEGTFPAGTEVHFVFSAIHKNGTLYLCADRQRVFSEEYGRDPVGEHGCDFVDQEGEEGEYRAYDTEHSAVLPRAASKLTIGVDGEACWFTISKILIRTAKEQTYTFEGCSHVPDGIDLREYPNSHVYIEKNKIYDKRDKFFSVIDQNWIGKKMDEYTKFSTETGTAVMLQEFGVFYPAPYDLTCIYLKDLLDAVNSRGISWCGYDFFGEFSFYALPENKKRDTADYVPFSKGWVASGMLQVLQDH